ncbi:MAG: hypothetical protein LBE36_06640 [Flavobacteriaceae bacterium]|jgi:hypothetical protein|nr:hypothetical protein [Flavobacteriaceae bacterium]
MEIEKIVFAKKHLSNLVRFTTALRLTSKTYMHGDFNAAGILFALTDPFDGSINGYQKNIIAYTYFSEETAYEIREFFIDLYNNDDALLKFLNKRVSERYFSQYTKKRRAFGNVRKWTSAKKGFKSEEVINKSVSAILNDNNINIF